LLIKIRANVLDDRSVHTTDNRCHLLVTSFYLASNHWHFKFVKWHRNQGNQHRWAEKKLRFLKIVFLFFHKWPWWYDLILTTILCDWNRRKLNIIIWLSLSFCSYLFQCTQEIAILFHLILLHFRRKTDHTWGQYNKYKIGVTSLNVLKVVAKSKPLN